MLRRFARDESGMTMGLVVVMIVLIGVMGAGLLTFVQRDLQSVIEVNRGQKSIEVTDAGIQAARRELLITSFPNKYNDPLTLLSPEAANSEWAFNSASATCGTLPSGPGKCISTAEGDVRVAIRYLPSPTNLSGVGAGSRTDPNFAPENPPAIGQDYPDKRDYFRVEADGVFSGSRRKVQAVMVTEDLGLPKAYFATENIDLGPSCAALTVTNVSLFARGNVTNFRDCFLKGTDLAYLDWQNGYNDKARLGRTVTAADVLDGLSGSTSATGAAAEGSVTYKANSYNSDQKDTPAENGDRYKRIDFDSTATLSGSTSPTAPTPNYKFCDKGTVCWPTGTAQPSDVITYPFNDNRKLDVGFLQSVAEQQISPTTGNDNYIETSGTSLGGDLDQDMFYQVDPALSSVFVVRFTGSPGQVDIDPTGAASPCPLKGIIIVINGNVDTKPNACFDGIIAIQDPTPLTQDLDYDSTGGGFVLNGFLNVEGTITLGGNIRPILGLDVLNSPGYHNVRIWSWRECYNTTCL